MFLDRVEAGRELAEILRGRVGREPLVLGLPRGGLPVAREVATVLGGELDALIVRKIGAPRNPELALGAIAPGIETIDWDFAASLGYSRADVEPVLARERAELERRQRIYRGDRPFPAVEGREVVIVDDGVATGATARAAARAVRSGRPSRLVFAAPVGTVAAYNELEVEVDDLVLAEVPPGLTAISQAYREFGQLEDADVVRVLAEARAPPGIEEVLIPLRDVTLDAILTYPREPRGMVVFAHGSGSGRRSSRNRYVAQRLHEAGYATLLVDLLSRGEARRDEVDASLRFDIDLLARRLEGVVDWVGDHARWRAVPLAIYGSSTGAAAALRVAAREPLAARAIVSRGGRVDLAGPLGDVVTPTLLIVGSLDHDVLSANEAALRQLAGARQLEVVEGAAHLFEEPGALDEVARLAVEWLRQHLDVHVTRSA